MARHRAKAGAEAAEAAELIERLGRLVDAEAYRGGLNPVQWQALRYLAQANRFSNAPGAVAEYLGATKGTVSQTLISLEAKGLVRREPRPGDSRSVALTVTRRGLEALDGDPLAGLSAAIEAAGQPGELRAMIAAVLAGQIAARGGRAFGLCHSCRHFRRDAPDGAPHRCALLGIGLSENDGAKICREYEPAVSRNAGEVAKPAWSRA